MPHLQPATNAPEPSEAILSALVGDSDTDLWAQAVCLQTDPEAFFPEKGENTNARVVCKECPIKKECLEYALEHDERFGIWGGMNYTERRRLKKASQAENDSEKRAA